MLKALLFVSFFVLIGTARVHGQDGVDASFKIGLFMERTQEKLRIQSGVGAYIYAPLYKADSPMTDILTSKVDQYAEDYPALFDEYYDKFIDSFNKRLRAINFNIYGDFGIRPSFTRNFNFCSLTTMAFGVTTQIDLCGEIDLRNGFGLEFYPSDSWRLNFDALYFVKVRLVGIGEDVLDYSIDGRHGLGIDAHLSLKNANNGIYRFTIGAEFANFTGFTGIRFGFAKGIDTSTR